MGSDLEKFDDLLQRLERNELGVRTMPSTYYNSMVRSRNSIWRKENEGVEVS